MKHFRKLILGACTALTLTGTPAPVLAQSLSPSTQWEWNKGTIVVKSPERPAGQKCALGLTVPKMKVVRVGFVGLGMRGPGAVERFTHIAGTKIVALCDYEKTVQKDARNTCRRLVCLKQLSIQVQKAIKRSANAMTLTWCILQPIGITIPNCQVCPAAWKERSH